MKLKFTLITLLFFFVFQTCNAQSEYENVTKTLMDYIEGTANGEPERVQRAFHEDLNLYSVKGDSLSVWNGQSYVSRIKEGNKSNRIGKIVSIDIENNAAQAKIEILMPDYNRKYTDYLILLKYQGEWKIIHKSFTYVEIPD